MKSVRILLSVLVIAVTAAGCDSDPVATNMPKPPCPVIGSGTGTC